MSLEQRLVLSATLREGLILDESRANAVVV